MEYTTICDRFTTFNLEEHSRDINLDEIIEVQLSYTKSCLDFIDNLSLFAKLNSLTIQPSENNNRISLFGNLKCFQAAFKITFVNFKVKDSFFRGYYGPVQIPKKLKLYITMISNLDNCSIENYDLLWDTQNKIVKIPKNTLFFNQKF